MVQEWIWVLIIFLKYLAAQTLKQPTITQIQPSMMAVVNILQSIQVVKNLLVVMILRLLNWISLMQGQSPI